MTTIEASPIIPPKILSELEETCADAMSGIRRPERMEEAAQELAEGREEIRRRLGVLKLSSELTDPDE